MPPFKFIPGVYKQRDGRIACIRVEYTEGQFDE